MKSPELLLVLCFLLDLVGPATPFSPFSKVVDYRSNKPIRHPDGRSFVSYSTLQKDATRDADKYHSLHHSSSSLGLFPAMTASGLIHPVARRTTAIVGAFVAIFLNLRRVFWPNSSPDQRFREPVPPGSFGCPFFGHAFGILLGSKEHGSNHFWFKMNSIMGAESKLWKLYYVGNPTVVLRGGKKITSFLNEEFHPNGIYSDGVEAKTLVGNESLLCVTDGKQHSFMRRLIGSAMTPSACNAAVPNLQALAEKQAEKMILQGKCNTTVTTIRDICTEYTLDVAWRQILGLNLQDDEEIETFYKMVDAWVKGFLNIRISLNLWPKQTKAYKAKQYIVSKIEEKIESVLKNGPDETTMSGMVFAMDDDGSSRKLSREQIISNALLLILAGTETSASTLTNAMLCLGLHRDSWDKLVEEQRIIQAKYGEALGREILERECPYLEGAIKEAMRLRPISMAVLRKTKTTKVIDGFQVPKGWGVFWNILLTHIHDPVTFKEDLSHMDVRRGYKPDRWLNKESRPSDDFIPMGGGPRYCLGSSLAFTEMKVFLAVLARKIDFKLVKSPEEALLMKRSSIIPLPADGVSVNVWSKSL